MSCRTVPAGMTERDRASAATECRASEKDTGGGMYADDVDLGTGTRNPGIIFLAAGIAGSDIAGVIYKSRDHEEVTATVSLGRFALRLPGDELQDAATDGVVVQVTYRDGTRGTSRLTL
jgi:hypothetical protein